MSVLQIEDLVTYQLRASYLNEFADGVGERLITLNESIVHSAPFKAAGWRTSPGLVKRTHSPPIPTAVASEYFRSPRTLGFTLEDGPDDSSGLLGGGPGGGGFGGGVLGEGVGGRDYEPSERPERHDSLAGVGTTATATAANKRRQRRREQMEEEDSSDLSDESEDEGSAEQQQRAVQQITFAKMPSRFRAGSSPLQSSNLRQPPLEPPASPGAESLVSGSGTGSGTGTIASSTTSGTVGTAGTRGRSGSGAGTARSARRRGSQTALAAVQERARADTATSSEVSSENEYDGLGRPGRRLPGRRLPGQLQRQDSDLLEEEREVDEDEASEDEESDEGQGRRQPPADDDDDDASDLSSTFAGSLDSASLLHAGGNTDLGGASANAAAVAGGAAPIIGTPPRGFTRTPTVRRATRSAEPAAGGGATLLGTLGTLAGGAATARLSTAMGPGRSLLTAALQAKKAAGAAMPFERFATLSGQGDPRPVAVRIYAPRSSSPTRPYEAPIRRTVQRDEGDGTAGERAVTVLDLIGLALWRYTAEQRTPPLPPARRHINWWTLRMVEEGGEVDDDFPPLERTRPLASFTTANNAAGGGGGGGRFRANSKVYDDFALVEATEAEFAANQQATPAEAEAGGAASGEAGTTGDDAGGTDHDGDRTPRNATPPPAVRTPPPNPIITTTYRHNGPHADDPPPQPRTNAAARGRKTLLRIHLQNAGEAAGPGQMLTLDVATDTYLAEVLDQACRKRQLDPAQHVLRMPATAGGGGVVRNDRTVGWLGAVADLELHRRRFADGVGAGAGVGIGAELGTSAEAARSRYPATTTTMVPVASMASMNMATAMTAAMSTTMASLATPGTQIRPSLDVGDATYRRFSVWRRQGLKIMGSSERLLSIDGEFIHIANPATGKVTTVHYGNVIGCKVSLRHPTHFKLIVYKATESKRYDFEAKTADEAVEIVAALKKAMTPYGM